MLTIWLVLVFARGNFWRCLDRDDLDDPPAPGQWPGVVAVVPARDEASIIATSLGSLLAQDYPGEFHIVLVDDQSADGTARIARECAVGAGRTERLVIVSGAPLPQGWTGKVWAMAQGVKQARDNILAALHPVHRRRYRASPGQSARRWSRGRKPAVIGDGVPDGDCGAARAPPRNG